MSIYPPDMKPTGARSTSSREKIAPRDTEDMKKQVLIIVCFVLLVAGFITLQKEIALKRSAKSTIVELCANYEYLNTNEVVRALNKLEAAIKGVWVSNLDQERQAASFVRSFKSTLEWAENDVKNAKDFLSKADNEYSREFRKESLYKEQIELAQKKKEFSEKMQIILKAY